MASMTSVKSTAPGHRRLAYQCLRCYHRDGKVRVDAKYRIEHHFLVRHMALDQVPHYCTLCQFRAFKREELDHHMDSFERHEAVRKEKGVENCPSMIVSCKKPYVITERDMLPLSAEESRKHWASRQKTDILQQALNAALATDEDTMAREVEQVAFGEMGGQDSARVIQEAVKTIPPSTATAPATIPVTLPASSSATAPAAALSTFQPLSPVIEASQILQPLQQLVNLFGGGLASATFTQPQATTAASQTTAARAQEKTAHPPAAEETLPIRAPSPVPSLPESSGVFGNMPSRDECKALGRSHTLSSSSSDSSADSACGHHEQILKEIQELKSSVQNFEGHFERQYASFQNLATQLLNMTKTFATPAQRQTTAPAATVQEYRQYSSCEQLGVAPERHQERSNRDRSPLRQRENAENRPRYTAPQRGNRRNDRHEDWSSYHQDRRNVKYHY